MQASETVEEALASPQDSFDDVTGTDHRTDDRRTIRLP